MPRYVLLNFGLFNFGLPILGLFIPAPFILALFIFAIGAAVPVARAQALRFVERTSTAGMDVAGLGRGVAVGDYDRDGDDDVFVAMQYGPSRLFRNDGTGSFTDVTAMSGLALNARFTAPVWADFDNDGYPDLLVGGFQAPSRLYRNRGDGTFSEATASSGIDPDLDIGSLGVADYDGDGWVDLFLAADRTTDHLYRNEGATAAFTFSDVSAAAGIQGLPFSVAMQSSWGDYDHDGDPDLFAVHDGEGRMLDQSINPLAANRLHRNPGYLPLADQANVVGFRDPGAGNSMGITWGDYDGDGWEDVYVSRKDKGGLYRNRGDGTFEIVAGAAGAERNGMAWGTVFGDFDNDGDSDLFVANAFGYYRMKSLLYENRGGSFTEVGVSASAAFEHEMTGVATADFDGDGRLDLVFSAYDGHVHLLSGASSVSGNWLRVALTGVQTNRMAIGARVEVRAGTRIWTQSLRAGDSYCSQSSAVLHFGLGSLAQVDEVRVHWGGAYVDVIRDVPTGRVLTITQSGATSTGSDRPPADGDGPYLGAPFPNPARGSVRLPYRADPTRPAAFEVIDLLGRVVAHPVADGREIVVDAASLAPGMYFVRMKVGERVGARALIVGK